MWYSLYVSIFREQRRLETVPNLMNIKDKRRNFPGGRVSTSQNQTRFHPRRMERNPEPPSSRPSKAPTTIRMWRRCNFRNATPSSPRLPLRRTWTAQRLVPSDRPRSRRRSRYYRFTRPSSMGTIWARPSEPVNLRSAVVWPRWLTNIYCQRSIKRQLLVVGLVQGDNGRKKNLHLQPT